MSRRPASVSKPHCSHHAAIWDAYDQAVRAYYDRAVAFSPVRERPESPKDADGYCAECAATLWAPGAVWPAEVWAYLHGVAAGQPKGSPPIRAYTLPAYHKPRSISAAKWLEQAIKAATEKDAEAKVRAVLGRPIVGDPRDPQYIIRATDGCMAVCEPGEPASEIPVWRGLSVARGELWIDLPPDVHAALRRVRLFANERSNAIRVSVGEFARIVLYASCSEYGEATETIENSAINQSPALSEAGEITITLNADYLDAICGCWPVRWYVRPPIRRQVPESRDQRARSYEEAQPQLFCPSGTAARVLVMPMQD